MLGLGKTKKAAKDRRRSSSELHGIRTCAGKVPTYSSLNTVRQNQAQRDEGERRGGSSSQEVRRRRTLERS